MLHSITFPPCKCFGIAHPILEESFFLLFREWLACQQCSKYNFTSTYGNPLFLEHIHIQTNICFPKRSQASITSKAVCPAAGLPAKGLKQLCQCYPLVTTLWQKRFFTAVFHSKKYNTQLAHSYMISDKSLYNDNNFNMATLTTMANSVYMHNNIDLCGTPCFGGQLYDVFNQSLNNKTVNNKN